MHNRSILYAQNHGSASLPIFVKSLTQIVYKLRFLNCNRILYVWACHILNFLSIIKFKKAHYFLWLAYLCIFLVIIINRNKFIVKNSKWFESWEWFWISMDSLGLLILCGWNLLFWRNQGLMLNIHVLLRDLGVNFIILCLFWNRSILIF